MREQFVFDSIVDSIPQWYPSIKGKNQKNIRINKCDFYFCSHRDLTPDLGELLHFCGDNVIRWLDNLPRIPSSLSKFQISQEIALKWLRIQNLNVDWYKLLNYAEELVFRTYENLPVTINIIISNQSGIYDITALNLQKFIDPLATSTQTFFKVDYDGKFIEFDQINWSEIKEAPNYKFNPEFLHPFACTMQEGEFSLHVTSKGDIIIMNSKGLVASCRKRRWHIYDVRTLKNSICDITGDYGIGCNLFEVLLDLSYKRHGALLVYDPRNTVINNVVNQEALLLNGDTRDDSRSMLAPSIKNIQMGSSEMVSRKKRVVLELASMDGALIFSNYNILAFGAMINTHPSAGGQAGARTTAFESAFQYGGIPFKVSSDGDISIKFRLDHKDGMITFL